jgi:hypothetical protein
LSSYLPFSFLKMLSTLSVPQHGMPYLPGTEIPPLYPVAVGAVGHYPGGLFIIVPKLRAHPLVSIHYEDPIVAACGMAQFFCAAE